MSTVAFGISIVGLTVLLAVSGIFTARKLVGHHSLKPNNQVADPMLQVIGTLYAVVLGLLVVHAMQRFEEARVNAEAEALALADNFRLATVLPEEVRKPLQENSLKYARIVSEQEWNQMRDEEFCDAGWEVVDKLWWDVVSFTPTTEQEKFIYPELLSSAKQLNDHRRTRLVTGRSRVPVTLWVVLILGAVVTIMFTYSFGLESVKAQVYMTALVATILSLNLYLWAAYSNPFSGALRLSAAPFELDAEQFEFYLEHPDQFRWHHAAPTAKKKRSRRAAPVKPIEEPDEKMDEEETDGSESSESESSDQSEPVIIDNDKRKGARQLPAEGNRDKAGQEKVMQKNPSGKKAEKSQVERGSAGAGAGKAKRKNETFKTGERK